MRFLLTRIAPLVAVVCIHGAPAYAQVAIDAPARAHPDLSDTVHPALPDFTMQQRAAIYNAVMQERSAEPLPTEMRVGVGTKLPQSVQLRPLPDAVRDQIAAAQKYQYAVWAKEVLVIDPAQRMVVDILRAPL
ncbi:MAG: DUF1236 domain-containing protein [Rhizobiales bacterium]|nr:DUF1236 domain-containing protein [Hyphomicrobiales bacterium]